MWIASVSSLVCENIFQESNVNKEMRMGYNAKRDDAYKEARKYAETSKEELIKEAKFLLNNSNLVKAEIEKIVYMSESEAEQYIITNTEEIFLKIKEGLEEIIKSSDKLQSFLKENEDACERLRRKKKQCIEYRKLTRSILDEDNVFGWGKYPEIVKELQIWILKIFCASYKKPTLFGILAEIITLPLVITGVKVFDMVNNCIEKEQQQKNKSKKIEIYHQNSKIIEQKRKYRNHCWNCYNSVTEEDVRCSVCGWYKCSFCGRCSKNCDSIQETLYEEELPFY